MASKTVFILSLTISVVMAKYMPIAEETQRAVCSRGRRMLTEQKFQNFTYDYDSDNPEAGPYFEGDILGIPDDIYDRNGIIRHQYRWPDNTIVFSIDGQFTYEQLESIEEAHLQITSATDGCIQFRERNAADIAYVSIVKGKLCASVVGYSGRRQEITLADGCFNVGWGTVAHEHIHTLGFFHQHSAPDRDDWVTIIWENIIPGYEFNFCKQDSDSNSYGEEYDYDSVMHYPRTAFSKNGRPTIVPKRPGVRIGQRDHISISDARKIMKMYGCL